MVKMMVMAFKSSRKAATPGGLIGVASAALRFIVLVLLMVGSAKSPAAVSYLDNGVVRIGIETNKGGSITYLSASGRTNNMVNSFDLGRQIQQSYYSGPQPFNPSNSPVNPGFPGWMWNPVQSGDAYTNASKILAFTNTGDLLYVKCRPMQWALSNVVADCTFESWIRLDGNIVIVSNRLVNFRADTQQQFAAWDQELPALYTVGTFYRLFSYEGPAPFTGGALTNFPVGPSTGQWVHRWRSSENWAAFVNITNWGVGVYVPGIVFYAGGFYGQTNTGGPMDNPTGYISPIHYEVLDSNIDYGFQYYLVLGTVQEIRDWVYAQPRTPACDFRFKSDRQHWWYANTRDEGWPVSNHVRVRLGTNDPQMLSPYTAFTATNIPQIYIRAAYRMTNAAGRNIGRLYWRPNNASNFVDARSFPFTANTNGQFRIYELNLASSNSYTGVIQQLRFDPVIGGDAGDYVDVEWITSLPPVEDKTIETAEDTPATIVLAASGLSTTNLDYDILVAPTNGTLEMLDSTNGTVAYLPATNYYGSDSFTFTAGNGSMFSTGSVSIAITPVNDPPQAGTFLVEIPEDYSTNVLFAASDVDSTNLTFAILDLPTHGTVGALDPVTHEATYTPDFHYHGADGLTFTASDGFLSATGIIAITVLPIYDAPVAQNQIVITFENTTTNFALKANFTDSSNLTYTVVQGPTNGAISWFDSLTGEVSYTPETDYKGDDALEFSVTDGSLSSTGLVAISVLGLAAPLNPDLEIRLESSNVIVSFPATSANTAGYPGQSLLYDLQSSPWMPATNWDFVPGFTNILGDDQTKILTNPPFLDSTFFRLRVRVQ